MKEKLQKGMVFTNRAFGNHSNLSFIRCNWTVQPLSGTVNYGNNTDYLLWVFCCYIAQQQRAGVTLHTMQVTMSSSRRPKAQAFPAPLHLTSQKKKGRCGWQGSCQ